MIEEGLIVEVEGGTPEAGERRRPYILSSVGQQVLSKEAGRLRRLLDQAATKGSHASSSDDPSGAWRVVRMIQLESYVRSVECPRSGRASFCL